MKTRLYDCIMENRDVSKVEKLLSLKNPDTFWDDVRRFTRNITSDHAIRRWECLSEIRFDELIMERDGKIEFGGYTIRESCHGISIEKGKDFLGFCDSIAECKNKIIFKEV